MTTATKKMARELRVGDVFHWEQGEQLVTKKLEREPDLFLFWLVDLAQSFRPNWEPSGHIWWELLGGSIEVRLVDPDGIGKP